MHDIFNVINSKIILSSHDDLWQDVPLPANDMTSTEVLILSPSLSDGSAEDTQLKKMMQACKLEPDQYVTIHLTEGKLMAWHKLRDSLKPKVVITLGISPEQLGIHAHFRMDAINNFNGCTWICTHSLEQLEKHPETKKDLWQNALKPVFVDNQ